MKLSAETKDSGLVTIGGDCDNWNLEGIVTDFLGSVVAASGCGCV